jgi:hypothetical protein
MSTPDFAQIQIQSHASKSAIIALLKLGLDHYYGLNMLKIIGSDPTLEGNIPCVAVNIASKNLQGEAIGQSEDAQYDDDPASPTYQKWLITRSTFFDEALEIRVWHTNADERDKLAPLVEGILYASLNYLAELGYTNIRLGSGRDEQAQGNGFPMPLYWYTLVINFWNPLTVKTVSTDSTIEAFGVTGSPNP